MRIVMMVLLLLLMNTLGVAGNSLDPVEIEKELIINIPRTEVEGFEATEKKPRLFKARPKKLSVKKAEAGKAAKKTGYAKTNTPEKKPAKKKKTTKRDANRSFSK